MSTFTACKDKKTEVVKPTTEVVAPAATTPTPAAAPTFNLETFTYKDIEKHAIVANGCLCSFKKADDKDNYLFSDNRRDIAVVKINGALVQLKGETGEKVEKETVYKKYKNENYTIEFNGVRSFDKKSDSGNINKGKLKISDATGKMISEIDVEGICGC